MTTRYRAGAVLVLAAALCTFPFLLDEESVGDVATRQEVMDDGSATDTVITPPSDLARVLTATTARKAASPGESSDPPGPPSIDPPHLCTWMPVVMCFDGGGRVYRGYRLRKKGRRQVQIEAGWAPGTAKPAQFVAQPLFTDLEPGSYELIDWATGARVDVELNSNCEGPRQVDFSQATVTYVAIYVNLTNGATFDGGVTVKALHGDFHWEGSARRVDGGVFEAFLPPGDYEFTALGRDFSKASTTASVADASAAEVVIDLVSVERFYANFDFRSGDAPCWMPSSWCPGVRVSALDGRALEARIYMRPATIPGASLAESLEAGMGGLTISILEEGSFFVSFPELENGTVLDDVLVDFGEPSSPAHVLQVGYE